MESSQDPVVDSTIIWTMYSFTFGDQDYPVDSKVIRYFVTFAYVTRTVTVYMLLKGATRISSQLLDTQHPGVQQQLNQL